MTYLIRSIIESEFPEKNKRLIDVFQLFLTFSKYICSYCEKDYCEFALKQDVFEWFKKNVSRLPKHASHALFGMCSHKPELKERAVQEILLHEERKHKFDSCVHKEALISLRTNLTMDDLEDLSRDLIKFDPWTERGIAYCIWRGGQFNQKLKHALLTRIAENNDDLFLKFLSQVRHADFDKPS